ncbi:MAG: sulfotransferase [Pseudomonadota bacterium]
MSLTRSLPPRPHPLARSPRIEKLSAFLERAWDKGWMPPPVLDADELWAIAAKRYASEAEFGGRREEDAADFRLRLERLTKAAREEADLNALGRTMAHGQLVRTIKHRLALGALWNKQPELLTTPLAPPIIIIGHMRSGTTRIHKLLAADPAHSHTRYCDAFHPVPARPDLRLAKGAAEIALLSSLNPWLQSIHPIASSAVEEELGWLAGALNHSIYEAQWHIPSYSAFSEARAAGPVYAEFKRLLQTDAAHRGNAHRPRVLKVPVFSENLPELLAEFPEARIIVAHRSKEAVHKSAVSLVANQMAVQSDSAQLSWIEAEWHRKIAMRDARREAALASWAGPIAHLEFDALNADWEAAISAAYKELGIALSDKALRAMRAMMAKADSRSAHAAHAEQLRGFASGA